MIAKLFFFCCLACCSVVDAGESATFTYQRNIDFQDDGQAALLAVPLDEAVYANSAGDFRDLRITDQNGVETPYLLQKITRSKTITRRLASASTTKNLEKIDNDGIVITVELDKDAANADGLTLVTAQHDFEYHLQIHGSNDGEHWEKLVNNQAIYDYSRYMAINNSDIVLPNNRYRHFKIVIAQASETHAAEVMELTRTLRGHQELQREESVALKTRPLHIERIDFWHNISESLPDELVTVDYPLAGFKVTQDGEHKTSLIDIDSLRQPLTGLTLKIETPNFSRHAEVQIPLQHGIETRMQTIAGNTLEGLHFQDINRDASTLTFAEQRQSRYRIVVQNNDNPPLEIKQVVGSGPGYQLLFLPQAGSSYRLHYGLEHAESPRYETAPIQELLRRGYQTRTTDLGPEMSAGAPDQGFDFRSLLNSKLFLGTAITLMVLVLGWSLFRVGKRVGEMGDDGRPR